MRKQSLVRFLLVLAVLLAGAAALLWYTRPMTLRQLCPEVDLARCSSITVYYEVVPSAAGNERLVLERGTPAFEVLLSELRERTFSRSLTSLLPRGTRTVRTTDGDFQWELLLEFDSTIVTPDGNEHQGMLLRLRNFFGRLSLDHMLADRTWDVTTKDQEVWVSQVMDIITAVPQPSGPA